MHWAGAEAPCQADCQPYAHREAKADDGEVTQRHPSDCDQATMTSSGMPQQMRAAIIGASPVSGGTARAGGTVPVDGVGAAFEAFAMISGWTLVATTWC